MRDLRGAGRIVKAQPEYYREQAAKSRRLAKRIDDPEMRSHMLQVAEQYDKLADEAEGKASGPAPGDA
jgi:hypothetical protein